MEPLSDRRPAGWRNDTRGGSGIEAGNNRARMRHGRIGSLQINHLES